MATRDLKWGIRADEFAVQIQAKDLNTSFFQRHLEIVPGHQAIIIEGHRTETVGPDIYTVESLLERMRFWKPKQCTAVIVREEDQRIELTLDSIPTRDCLFVDASIQLGVRIENVDLFLKRVMGARPSFSIHELEEFVLPFVKSAFRSTLAEFGIEELASPESQRLVDSGIEGHIQDGLRDYGLKFTIVQASEVRHKKWNENQELVGEAFLLEKSLESRAKISELYNEEELQQIAQLQHDVDMEQARAGIKTERLKAKIETRVERIQAIRGLRQEIVDERTSRLIDRERLDEAAAKIDKKKVLRESDLLQLKAEIADDQLDEQQRRERLRDVLSQQHRHELDRFKEDFRREDELLQTEHEIKILRLNDSEENRQHAEKLQRDQEAFQLKFEQEDAVWKRDLERKTAEWRLTVEKQERIRDHQLRTLAQLNDARQKEQEARHKRYQERKQQAHENEVEKLDVTEKQALDRMAATRGMSVEEMISVSDEPQAQMLTNLNMHQASEETRQIEARENSRGKDALLREQKLQSEEARARDREYNEQRTKDLEGSLGTIKEITGQAFAAMGKQPAGESKSEVQAAQVMIKCAACGQLLPEDSRACSRCGSSL